MIVCDDVGVVFVKMWFLSFLSFVLSVLRIGKYWLMIWFINV